jgi:hypothetical protein
MRRTWIGQVVDDMVRFYLGEEPVLRSVHSYDVGDPAARGKDTWVLR